MKETITREDISKHIECYYMHHEDSNGKVKPQVVKAYRFDDLNWLFNNIERLEKAKATVSEVNDEELDRK